MPWSIIKDSLQNPTNPPTYPEECVLENDETKATIVIVKSSVVDPLNLENLISAYTIRITEADHNKNSYDQLPKEVQAIVSDCSGRLNGQDYTLWFEFRPSAFLEQQLISVFKYLKNTLILPANLIEEIQAIAPARIASENEAAFMNRLNTENGLTSQTFEILLKGAIELDESCKDLLDSSNYTGPYSFYLAKRCLQKGLKHEAIQAFTAILNYHTDESFRKSIYNDDAASMIAELEASQGFTVSGGGLDASELTITQPSHEDLKQICHKHMNLMSQGAEPRIFFQSLIAYAGFDQWDFADVDFNDKKGFEQVIMKLADTCYQLKQETAALKAKYEPQKAPLLLSDAAKTSASASSITPPSNIPTSESTAAAAAEPASKADSTSYSSKFK